MKWRSEETLSNQVLNDIFTIVVTHYYGNAEAALYSIAMMAADPANDEHSKYLAYLNRPKDVRGKWNFSS